MDNNVDIKERATTYDIKLEYHSDLLCENHDAELKAISEGDGRISFEPCKAHDFSDGFFFVHSDPDLVIALARMMLAFAEMVKRNNKSTIDIEPKA